MNKIILLLPIIFTSIISIFLLLFLLQNKDPNIPPSALLDEEIPKVKLVNLFDKNKLIDFSDFENKNVLINFFASWCAPCRAEHKYLINLAKKSIPDRKYQ